MSELLPNLRDVGGFDATDGVVATGRLLRSAAPAEDDIVPDDIIWPPGMVIDLRSDIETSGLHPLSHTGAVLRQYPLLTALRPGVAPPDTLEALYALMLEKSGHLLNDIVIDVADAAEADRGPALVHCAAGKDRTGVSVALVLRLLGVARDDVVGDYLATAQNWGQVEARFRRMYGERRAELPLTYAATPVEAITRVLDVWDDHDGGPIGWFQAVGGELATVDRLRSRLVV